MGIVDIMFAVFVCVGLVAVSRVINFFCYNWCMLIGFLYKSVLRPILFLNDSEVIHERFVKFGNFLGRYRLGKKIVSSLFFYSDKSLEQNILGINFKNPIGLAAGFDKNARLVDILPSVGFGFMEVGSITSQKCEGNPKPRLWRAKKSKGIVVYYGLVNDGCEKIFKRLITKKFDIPLGISIAKTNSKDTAETEAGISDYFKAYKTMLEIGNYITINISCPNAFGGEPFTDPTKLEKLLKKISETPKKKPIFLKLSPDLKEQEIDAILAVCGNHAIDGFICSNSTKKRVNIIDENLPEKGGISGKPMEELADNLIKYIYKRTNGKYVIIGCGGVFSAEDAYKKIKLGASLVQLISGMIYEGPQLIGEINKGLVHLLKKDGFDNISQVIGMDNSSRN